MCNCPIIHMHTQTRTILTHNVTHTKEIMVMAHNKGKFLGYGAYDVIKGKQGKTLLALFQGGKDQTITAKRKKKSGGVKGQLAHNPHRNQNLHGDIFVDNFPEVRTILRLLLLMKILQRHH